MINFETFLETDIRVGMIKRAEPYPEAKVPAIKVWVDFKSFNHSSYYKS